MAIKSAGTRTRVQNHIARLVAAADPAAADGGNNPDNVKLAQPGDMQLYNFYKPSLVAGRYTITVEQSVVLDNDKSKTEAIDAPTAQIFDVVQPQFSIDPSDVHSCYPPQGHADQPMILPHIIFNDAHLPWERLPSTNYKHDPKDNSICPWIATIPFDPNGLSDATGTQELRVTSAVANFLAAKSWKPAPDFSYQMKVSDFLALPVNDATTGAKFALPNYGTSTNDDYSDITKDTSAVNVIFITAQQFKNLFVDQTSKINLSNYEYCAHTRNINTLGMVDAGTEDKGVFSVVHSRRSGPTDIKQDSPPRTQVVHVISLEFIQDMSIPSDDTMVGLVSLYSWSYLCQPPLSVNFVDSMRAIGLQVKDKNQSNLLRYPETIINNLIATIQQKIPSIDPNSFVDQGSLQTATDTRSKKISDLQSRMSQRMLDGYSIVRHRLATGEQTIAYNRGPFVPLKFDPTLMGASWPVSSNTGQDYMVIDPHDGTIDISYSTAWQLGKTMAISDFAFVTALSRIRRALGTAGVQAAAFQRLALVRDVKTVQETMRSVGDSIKKLNQSSTLPASNVRGAALPPKTPPSRFTGSGSHTHPSIIAAFAAGVDGAATQASAALGEAVPRVYDEITTTPASSDWSMVLTWMMDKLYFSGIAGHHLVVDPAYLPRESIRFFHVNHVWTDCFMDGALSVANHFSRTDDSVRQSIKTRFNEYLQTKIGVNDTAHYPPVPTFGFLLRSAVVTAFPDLHIDIPFAADPTVAAALQGGRPSILAQQRMGKDILMILLDREPSSGYLSSIKITQPAHQQCFSVGDFLDANTAEFAFRKVYPSMSSDEAKAQFLHEMSTPHTWTNGTAGSIYNWTSRCLDMNVLNQTLFGQGAGSFSTELPGVWPSGSALDSSMTALQLNDCIFYLEMLKPDDVNTPTVAAKTSNNLAKSKSAPRQLFLGPDTETLVAAAVASRAKPKPKSQSTPAASVKPAPAPIPIKPSVPASSAKPTPSQTTPSLPASSVKPASTSTNPPAPEASVKPTPTSSNPPVPPSSAKPTPTPTKPSTQATPTKAESTSAKPSTTSGPVKTAPQKFPGPIAPSPSKAAPVSPPANSRRLSVIPPPNGPVPTLQPQFISSIYPSTAPYVLAPAGQVQPSWALVDTPYDCDLIVSIALQNTKTASDLCLNMLELKIPVGDASTRTAATDLQGPGLIPGEKPPTVTDPIDGSTVPNVALEGITARMLSNQRWVVHLDPAPPYLYARLLPRTTLRYVPLLDNQPSLSFKLSGVPLAGRAGTTLETGTVVVQITEIYRKPGSDGTLNTAIEQGRPVRVCHVDKRLGWGK